VWGTISRRAVLNSWQAWSALSQALCGQGPADDEAGPPRGARPRVGVGRRWPLCGGVANVRLCQTSRHYGVALALGRRAVSSAGAPAPRASTVLNPRRGSPPLFETHVEQHTRAPPRHPLSKEAANRDGRPPQKGFARGV
jgi:hypothetical protein